MSRPWVNISRLIGDARLSRLAALVTMVHRGELSPGEAYVAALGGRA